jgi:hypothetical protein
MPVMPSMQPFETVVFVAIPDPDNILMILYVLAVFKGRVAIVISPRVVDLSVVRYGERFTEMKDKLGLETMIRPITKGNEPADIPKEWGEFFQADSTLSDPKVLKDTALYVRVSKARIKECIEERFPQGKSYEIFWDPDSLSKTKEPYMRHAFHAADYTFNFNKKELEKYHEYRKENRGSSLRKRRRKLCRRYITRVTKDTDHVSTKPEPMDVKDLFEANREVKDARLIIGGPLTEALQYIESVENRPKVVYTMLGTLTEDCNLSGRPQCNLRKDMTSAFNFLEKIKRDWIPLFAVPTEGCKGKGVDNLCPYVPESHQWQDWLENSPVLHSVVRRWVEETGLVTDYSPFDLITAIAAKMQDIFNWIPVTYEAHRSDTTITNITFAETLQGSPIFMVDADYAYMNGKKSAVLEEMERISSKDETRPTEN